MSVFSDTLSGFIEDKKVRVYDLIRFLQIDRSTLYQILKGKRIPPSDEQISRISDFLRLSPSEREELFKQAQITRLGENLYYQRKGVEQFLLEFPDDLSMLWKDSPVRWRYEETELMQQDQENAFLPSEGDVLFCIQRLIRKEMQNKGGHIALMLQPEENTLFDLLRGMEPAHTLRVEHLICLSSADEMTDKHEPLYIRYLNTILPLYVRDNIEYNAFYYYDRIESHFMNYNGFSGMLLTSEAALLVTSDYRRGIVLKKPDIVRGIWELYKKYQADCQPLFDISRVDMQDFAQIQMSNDTVTDEVALYVLEREVCLLILVTENVLRKCYSPDMPGREIVIENLDRMLQGDRRKLESGNWHMYFTREGLDYFVKTGKFKELPDGVYVPLGKEEKIEMLTSLRKYCEKGMYRMLSGKLRHLSGNLRLCINGSIGYLILSGDNRQVVYMYLTEPNYLSIFRDYMENLDDSNFYDNEETVRMIDEICATRL